MSRKTNRLRRKVGELASKLNGYLDRYHAERRRAEHWKFQAQEAERKMKRIGLMERMEHDDKIWRTSICVSEAELEHATPATRRAMAEHIANKMMHDLYDNRISDSEFYS